MFCRLRNSVSQGCWSRFLYFRLSLFDPQSPVPPSRADMSARGVLIGGRRYRRHDHAATLCAFDIIELDGADLRGSPIHEIKHDGFRILARKDGDQVKLITRNGYDFANRYVLIVDAIASLPVETCVIDGEAIVVDQNGLAIFDLLQPVGTAGRHFGFTRQARLNRSGDARW